MTVTALTVPEAQEATEQGYPGERWAKPFEAGWGPGCRRPQAEAKAKGIPNEVETFAYR